MDAHIMVQLVVDGEVRAQDLFPITREEISPDNTYRCVLEELSDWEAFEPEYDEDGEEIGEER